jgi:hypothetical protein
MPQRTDLYTVLNVYARKNDSPLVDMETFISFLEKYARRICEEKPEWTKWTEETGTRVWMEMNRLVEDGKVVIQNDGSGNTAVLAHYFAEQVKDAYRNPDRESGMPFPDEHSLNLQIPHEQLRPLDIASELSHFLEKPQEEMLPIIKLVFPGDRGSALVPAPMIPITLLEFSILKIRDYLNRRGNKEYVNRKLLPQLAGKEDYLKDMLDKITIRPADSLNDLKAGREISFVFWAHFCSLVRTDLSQKKDLLAEELGALQAVYLTEICSNFFKNKAVRAKEIELAFKNFELEMEKPPYFFSREIIAKFKDNKGVSLLGIYTQDGLDAYIKKRITEPPTPNELPELLYFYTEDHKAWLIKKNKLLQLCARLLTEARSVIIKIISRRWKKMLRDFTRESAMEDDREFEKLIASYIDDSAPMLKTLLKDRRLYLVHEEMRASEKGIPESSRLFNRDELLPMRVLLLLKRKELLSDIKLLMPFWYSIPIISGIIAFFANLGKKKKLRKEEAEIENKKEADDPLKELRVSAADTIAELVPRGKSLDAYLDELASRWGHIVNKQARQNLIEDVNSLVRDRLRMLMRLQKNAAVSKDTLDKLTNSIMDNSEGLMKITEQNTLFLYIKLYLGKLLVNRVVV